MKATKIPYTISSSCGREVRQYDLDALVALGPSALTDLFVDVVTALAAMSGRTTAAVVADFTAVADAAIDSRRKGAELN